MAWRHFGPGGVLSGGKSPGMNTLALQPPQVTIRNCFFSSPATVITSYTIAFFIPTTSLDIGRSSSSAKVTSQVLRCPVSAVGRKAVDFGTPMVSYTGRWFKHEHHVCN